MKKEMSNDEFFDFVSNSEFIRAFLFVAYACALSTLYIQKKLNYPSIDDKCSGGGQ